jgi:hypothetical protein
MRQTKNGVNLINEMLKKYESLKPESINLISKYEFDE